MRATPSSRSNRRSTRLSCAAALLCAVTLASPAARAQGGDRSPAAENFTIARTHPDAVIRFHGLTLEDARTDPAQNEIMLRFDGAADPALFARLQNALPAWVATATAGRRSAVIRARRPVTFMTRRVRDGFAVRLVATHRPVAESAYLRGQMDGGQANVDVASMQRDNPRDAFELRGPDLGGRWHSHAILVVLQEKPLAQTLGRAHEAAKARDGGFVAVSGHWRHPRQGRLVDSGLAAEMPVGYGVKLVAAVHDVDAEGKTVRRLNGTYAKLNENTISAAAGLAFSFGGLLGPGELRGEALWGKSGWGGRLGYAERLYHGSWGFSGDYHAPFEDTLEAVAERGYRDRAELDFARRLARELWFDAKLHAMRYGAEGDEDVAETAGASASLRYLVNLDGIWAGLTYEFNGDYVLKSRKYLGASPKWFTPLDIHTFEVHALSASLSRELFRGFWIDAYGGYAIDRYGPDGYFGGGQLRYAMAPGWALTLGGGYSQISTRQGERGPVTTAGIKLVYDWDAAGRRAPARPPARTDFGSL